MTKEELHDAFAWSRKLFGLSREDKMKAPHPAEAMPHRGYSGPGLEKVYSKEERDKDAAEDDTGEALRKIEDHKVRASHAWHSIIMAPKLMGYLGKLRSW